MVGDRSDIVRKQNSIVLCSPFENHRIIGAGQPHILHAGDINGWISPQQSAQDIVVEVLISQQGSMSATLDAAPRGERVLPQVGMPARSAAAPVQSEFYAA